MDSVQTFQSHISIQKGLSIPTLKKCYNCCNPSQFHCPFCLPNSFKPTKRSRAMLHMDNHIRRAIYVGEYTIHRCGLSCRKRPHYHCLYCKATLIRRRDFTNHLPLCRQSQQRKAHKRSQMQTAATEQQQTQQRRAHKRSQIQTVVTQQQTQQHSADGLPQIQKVATQQQIQQRRADGLPQILEVMTQQHTQQHSADGLPQIQKVATQQQIQQCRADGLPQILEVMTQQQTQQCSADGLPQIQKVATQRIKTEPPSPTPGESDIPSYHINSNNDSDDKTIIPKSEDQCSQEASSSSTTTTTSSGTTSSSSSSQAVTPVMSKSNKCDGTSTTTSKCHRTVQTNLDKPRDCDEFYFMTLVELFKKLAPRKQADVRLKIERLLFEAEFD